MAELSKAALRVLRKIHKHGLIVRWSHQVPHPRYEHEFESENGKLVSEADWRVIRTQLEESGTRRTVVDGGPAVVYVSREYGDGGIWHKTKAIVDVNFSLSEIKDNQTFQKMIDDIKKGGVYPEQEIGHDTFWGYMPFTTVPQVEIVMERNPTYHEVHYRESVWLDTEKIDQDEYFEEFVGMVVRYTLTAKALEAIGVKA